MYDPKQEACEFVGEDREEAVSKASAFYGVDASELKIVEPNEGELFGAGGRAVVIAVPPGGAQISRSSGNGGGRRQERDREPRGGRDRDRERDRDSGRDGGREGGRRRREGGRGREARAEREEEQPERDEDAQPMPEATAEESKGTVEGEMGPIGDFLLGVVERMRLGPFEIAEAAEGDFVVYQLRGPAAIALGAGDGRAVDALQLLANQAAMRGSDDSPRVVVDAEGDAERREAFLSRLAERAARRASDTGRSVALDAMNARDRRMIHVAIRDIDGVASMSSGSGRYRQVVVVPEGAPEYEEARESAQSAAERERDSDGSG